MTAKTLTAILVVVLALLTPAFAAGPEQDSGFRPLSAAEMQTALAISIPDDNLPGIENAVISVKAAADGDNPARRVSFIAKSPRGQFIARAYPAGSDAPFVIGTWGVDSMSADVVARWTLINGDPSQVLPYIGQFWKVDVVRVAGGPIAKVSANVSPYADTLTIDFSVGGQQVIGEKYNVTLTGNLGPDTTVVIGGWGLAEFHQQLGGGGVAGIPVSQLPPYGSMSITVCTAAQSLYGNGMWCGTDVFRRKVPVNIVPGKG